MRVGILVLSIGTFGSRGYYNLQEVGLAKALDRLCDEVEVYKLVEMNNPGGTELIEGTKNASMVLLPSKKIGTNGIPNLRLLNNTLDVLICFSDTQLMFPRVYRWTKKNHIYLLPYIGVAKSHSERKFKAFIINSMFRRNIRIYKKCTCLVKTPGVKNDLETKKIKDVKVCPIGLDISLVKKDYEQEDVNSLKKQFGYASNDKIVLFIGRLIQEKEPIRMLRVFNEIQKKDSHYKLLMVGKGEKLEEIKSEIGELEMKESVQIIEQIPNNEIWKLYRIADCLINLNKHEIYGMVLLEAMYYGCKVIAWTAPGPDYIIEDKKTGYLVSCDEEIIQCAGFENKMERNMKERVITMFTWDSTAAKILEYCEGK